MLDEKESSSSSSASSISGHCNRSFGRQNPSKDHHHLAGHFQLLSWSVSRSWSTVRQLQAIGNNLVIPKGSEVIATSRVAVAVSTMLYCLETANDGALTAQGGEGVFQYEGDGGPEGNDDSTQKRLMLLGPLVNGGFCCNDGDVLLDDNEEIWAVKRWGREMSCF
ncbi:hypothetical protein Tsubulata_008724 [Turnera subulata]|uniref:Uncharacterized protein n=1 Tax=Turnera subulata TaxID=218843 RepID=A0A9Q0JIP2_9ROSI|nr:hypothetical protein Tsubulata_008724 [Turnera subulata]